MLRLEHLDLRQDDFRLQADLTVPAGARVAVQDIALDKAQAVAATITAAGGAALALAGDVSVAAEVEGLVAKTVAWGGGLHLLVNNAGIGGPSAPTGDYPLDGWDKVISAQLDSRHGPCNMVELMPRLLEK